MRVKSEAESSPTSLQISIFLSVSKKEESRLAACDVLADALPPTQRRYSDFARKTLMEEAAMLAEEVVLCE